MLTKLFNYVIIISMKIEREVYIVSRYKFRINTENDTIETVDTSNGEVINVCNNSIEDLVNSLMFANIDETEAAASVDTQCINVKTPAEIKEILDRNVIGQERAKKVISVGIYNHYKRIVNDRTDIQKSNILMVGPTGCGNTEIARTVAKVLDVPFVICDATTVTEAGYVGDDVENMLLRLIQAADFDIEAAERGIIYIDEIDKIACIGEST